MRDGEGGSLVFSADFQGGSYELQLHEQLPWTAASGSGCSSIAFDSHCVASFFISFRCSQSDSPLGPPSAPLCRCRVRFSFATVAEEQLGEAGSALPALLSLEVTRSKP